MGTASQTALQSIPLSRTRAFGNDFAPPRQEYITFIPALLAFTGVMSWVMADELGMVVASAVATAVAFYDIWGWLIRRGPTRFSSLMALAFLFGYGAGVLNTWVTLPRGGLDLADVVGMDQGVLSRGLGAVLVSSALLYFLGEIFEKPIFGRDFRFTIDQRTRTLIYAGTLAILVGYSTHSLAIEGAASGEGHVSIPGVFLAWLYTPLTAIAVSAFFTARRRGDQILTGVASLLLLMVFSVMGRRIILYTSLEILLVLGLTGYRWRERMVRNIFLGLALLAIMVAGALTFMLLRVAQGTTTRTTTISKRFEIAGKLVRAGGAISLATGATQNNFQKRTFVLGFLANILDASSRQTPALGHDALSFLETDIPSVIYPDKDRYFNEEALVDQQFGFSYGDEANSVLTAGATDFGLLGMILYPLIMVAIARTIFEFVALGLKVLPLMLVALSFVYTMLQTENNLSGYFEVFRDTLLFGIVLAIFLALPRINLRDRVRYD